MSNRPGLPHITAKHSLYGNWLVLSPENVEMFRTSEKRARWYLNRSLAEQIKTDPPVIRLLFTPNGLGNADSSKFYLAPKENICVVCGSTRELTKHHIVPQFYRRHFPDMLKCNTSHDVLLVCEEDHHKYEDAADKLKDEIAHYYGVPRHKTAGITDEQRALIKSSGFARTLLTQYDRIPSERRTEMLEFIKVIHGHTELHLIEKPRMDLDINSETQGEVVVKRLIADNDVVNFCTTWREHFVKHTQPKFLPSGWETTYDYSDKSGQRLRQFSC